MNKPGPHNEPDSLEVFFSKNLGEASMEPSAGSWEHIEQTLEQDRKEKRKKRFWLFFAGLVVLTGLSVSGFFFFKNTWTESEGPQAVKTIASVHNANTSNLNANAINTDTLQKQTTGTTEAIHETSANAPLPAGRIQVGAFRRKVKPVYFEKISMHVQQETGSDGVTRYYIQSADTLKDLTMVREAGFPDAFVQKEGQAPLLLASAAVSRKAKHGKKNNGTVNLAKNLDPARTLHTTKKTQVSPTIDPIRNSAPNPSVAVMNAPVQKNTDPDPAQKQPATTSLTVADLPLTLTTPPDPPKDKESRAVFASDDSNAAQSPPPLLAIDTVQNPPPKDTLVNVVRPDTTQTLARKTGKDSSFLPPFNRWAIAVIGGPLFSFNQASEKLPLTYTGDLRVEYFPVRNLSVTGGISYQENKIEQNKTRFMFSKYISSDYQVQSSYGAMAIPKDLLLQGLFLQAPVDSFAANYKYDAKIQSLSIPVQANWYFLNKRALQLSVSGGLYTSYVFAQKSHLTLIKEHSETELSYQDVKTNRLNLLMMFSLGCDVRITKRLYFTVAPSYKYGVTNYSNTPGYVFKPSAFAATGGFKLKL
jgi:hypothetical protein